MTVFAVAPAIEGSSSIHPSTVSANGLTILQDEIRQEVKQGLLQAPSVSSR